MTLHLYCVAYRVPVTGYGSVEAGSGFSRSPSPHRDEGVRRGSICRRYTAGNVVDNELRFIHLYLHSHKRYAFMKFSTLQETREIVKKYLTTATSSFISTK